jgi:hypothetical protein
MELYRAFARAWAVPIVGEQHNLRQTPSPGPSLVSPAALAALGGLSVYLAAVAPEGRVPDEERVSELVGTPCPSQCVTTAPNPYASANASGTNTCRGTTIIASATSLAIVRPRIAAKRSMNKAQRGSASEW